MEKSQNVPGSRKGGFNYRWAQTTHHPKHIEGNYFPADHFPFNFTPDGEWLFDPYPIPAYNYGGIEFPALRHSGKNLKSPRIDYGLRFFMPMPPPINMVDVQISYHGIQDNVSPDYFRPPYESRVPNFDEDGNDFGGIRMPDLTVPLGTYQGWNPRRIGTGASDFLRPFDASCWPFALTRMSGWKKAIQGFQLRSAIKTRRTMSINLKRQPGSFGSKDF